IARAVSSEGMPTSLKSAATGPTTRSHRPYIVGSLGRRDFFAANLLEGGRVCSGRRAFIPRGGSAPVEEVAVVATEDAITMSWEVPLPTGTAMRHRWEERPR